MAKQQINVRIPENLFIAAREAPESITELVVDGLRWRLGWETPDIPGLFANQEAIRDAVNDLDGRVEKLERRAEEAGAL